MLKKVLITLATVIGLTVASAYVFREELMMALASQMGPQADFDATLAPPAPDYADPENWAALPSTTDASDDHPDGLSNGPITGVSVFFVHPTSYFGRDNWNQSLDDAAANWVVDERVLRHQASVFNGCCQIYAPRYRQATIFAFIDQSGNGAAALDFAYQDVVRAFDRFLMEIGDAPFILAGHSQGSLHGARLLRERIAGKRLAVRLVAAYLIGYSVAKDNTGGIPVCDHASATGCVIGWNTVDGDGVGIFPEAGALVCTNPLTWEDDGAYAGHELNLGGVGYPSFGPPIDGEDVTRMEIEPGVADAECKRGVLSVPELRSASFPSRMSGDSMHVYDYSLYYLNLRQNAATRVRAFLDKRRA
jgi:hypothetical protein